MVLTKPGIVKLCKHPDCGALKVPGVHHCSKCKKCTYHMDHHCPWTDNCVGIGNFKYFVLFNIYTTLQTFIGLLVIIKNKICNSEEKHLEHLSFNPFWIILDFDTVPLREMIAYFSSYIFGQGVRDWLLLSKVDDDGQWIWEEG